MTWSAEIIAPLVPPQSSLAKLIEGPQPATPPRPGRRRINAVYAMSTVGEAGRITSRVAMEALDWGFGTRLSIEHDGHDVVELRAVPDGEIPIHPDGYFRVPYRMRRRIGLHIGDRPLLVAYPTRRLLTLYSPHALADALNVHRDQYTDSSEDSQ